MQLQFYKRFRNAKQARWLVLVAFVISLLPIPMSALPSKKFDSDAQYPCQGCACSCNSAEQCWSSCCCHTPEERLAWAKKHNIIPPSSLLLALDADSHKSKSTIAKSCCSNAKSKKSCCSIHDESSKHPPLAESKLPSTTGKKRVKYLMAFDVLKCQGKSSIVTLLSATILSSCYEVVRTEPQIIEVTKPFDDAAYSVVLTIDSPPPRHL